MGMPQQKKRIPVFYILAMAACLLLVFAVAYISLNGKKTLDAVAVDNGQTEKPIQHQGPTVIPNTLQPGTSVATGSEKAPIHTAPAKLNTVRVPLAQATMDTAAIAGTAIKQEVPNTAIQAITANATGTVDSVSMAKVPTIKKAKQRYFQMDFGTGTPSDPKQKVASNKFLQFRFTPGSMETGNGTSSQKIVAPQVIQPL